MSFATSQNDRSIQSLNLMQKRPVSLALEVLVLGLVVLAIFLPRAPGLGRFVTPDEYKWIARSANFYSAIRLHDFASTFQTGHPGVAVMWAGTAAFLKDFPEYVDLQTKQLTPDDFHKFMGGEQAPVTPLELLRDSRRVMVILHVIVLAISYLYARRLFGTLPALAGFILIAFDPFHVGLTRLLHLDGLMTNFMLLSTLAFLAYLYLGRTIDVLVSGIAAALGFLTRSPAIALIPVIGLLFLWELWKSFRRNRLTIKDVWQALWPMLGWLAVFIITIFVLWPAMWVNPLHSITQIFSVSEAYALEGHSGAIFFNGQVIPDGNLGVSFYYFYPLTYLWRVTPVVLIGLVCALWGYLKRRKPFDNLQVRLTLQGLLLMVIIYTVLMTLGAKKFDRYLLPIYPVLDIIGGLGWYSIAMFFWAKKWPSIMRYATLLILLLVFVLQVASSTREYPYYLSYYNPLLGGSRKAPQVMEIGWGEGLDQAASYLNSKPKVNQLKVATLYPDGSFSYFFNGNNRLIGYPADMTPEMIEHFYNADYAIIYISQWQRQFPQLVLDYVSKLTPEQIICFNGLEYARIYKMPGANNPGPQG